jgi:hypothetical protein
VLSSSAAGAVVTGAGAGAPAAVEPSSGVAPLDVEPNDSFSQAERVTEGVQSGTVNDSSPDVYAIRLNQSEGLEANLTTPSDADVDLQVYSPNPNYDPLVGATGGASDPLVRFDPEQTDTFYVEVRTANASNVSYSLDLDVLGSKVIDRLGPDDRRNGAPLVEEGFYDNLTAFSDELDVYRIDLERGEGLRATVSNDERLDMRVFDSETATNPVVRAPEPDSGDDPNFDPIGPQSFTFQAEQTTTYYIVVESMQVNNRFDYSLDINLINRTENDPYEFNNRREDAGQLNETTYNNLSLVGDESDFFKIRLERGEGLQVTASNDERLDLRMWRGTTSTSPVVRAPEPDSGDDPNFDPSGPQSFVYKADATDVYYVEVESQQFQNLFDYTLDVNLINHSENDPFELNNDRDTAARVDDTTYDNLSIVGDETDYFKIDLRRGEGLRVQVSNDERLDVKLWDSPDATSPVARAPEPDSGDDPDFDPIGPETLVYQADANGTYYVEVESKQFQNLFDYSMLVDRINASENDPYEFNNDRETAAPLMETTYRNLSMVGDEFDYFKLYLEQGEGLKVSVSNDERQDLRLFDGVDAGQPVRVAPEPDLGDDPNIDPVGPETLVHYADESGMYYLEVESRQSQNLFDYTMTVDVVNFTENGLGEPNNRFETAQRVYGPEFRAFGLRTVGDERDVYAVDAVRGDTLSVQVDGAGSQSVRLYDANLTQLAGDTSGDATKRLTATAPHVGQYYVEVASSDPHTIEAYDLEIDGSTVTNDPLRVTAPADPVVRTQTDDPVEITAGGNRTLTYYVENAGQNASDVTLGVAELPANLSIASVNGSGTYNASLRSITWEDLPAGANVSANVTYTATADASNETAVFSVYLTNATSIGGSNVNYADVESTYVRVATEPSGRFSDTLFPNGIPGSSTGQAPTNADEDVQYEDMTGDGRFDFADVIEFVFALDNIQSASLTPTQIESLDHSGDGRVTFVDVIDLVFQL